MQYLRIANPGEAPTQGFTLFGVSTTRYAKHADTIGQFGSGSKHAVNLCLRNDIAPIIFCGTQRMDFFVEPVTVDDGLSSRKYGQVCVRHNKSRTEKLSLTIEHGVQDWSDLSMGLREFVSNAIDRTVRETDTFKEVEIKIVEESAVRAKSGTTQVFIPLTDAVQQFYRELPKRFLHFSEPYFLKPGVLPKRQRNLHPGLRSAVFYKKGVYIGESMYGAESIYDYSFGDDLLLDESRNANPYHAEALAAHMLSRAPEQILAGLFEAAIKGERRWELNFSTHSLAQLIDCTYEPAAQAQHRDRWRAAWERVAGKKAIACHPVKGISEAVEARGYKPCVISSEGLLGAMKKYCVPLDHDVLSIAETKGGTVIPATPAMLSTVEEVWSLFAKHNLTNGRLRPLVHGFQQIMTAGSQTWGYAQYDEVYLHEELAGDQLFKVALEEVAHHVTGAADSSRDLQDFTFRLITAMR